HETFFWIPPLCNSVGIIQIRREDDRWRIRDGQSEGVIGFVGRGLIEQQINADYLWTAGLNVLDQVCKFVACPRPCAHTSEAVFIYGNDERRTRRCDRAGKPKS